MKKFLIASAVIAQTYAFSQEGESINNTKPNFNRWSIDLNLGVNKTVRNFAPGYGSAFADIGELNFGARFMVNSYFGVDFKFGFDRFQDGAKNLDFSTNMSRFGVQGIISIGNALNFHEWTDRFNVLMHTGIGVGNIADEGFPIYKSGVDKVGTFTFGLTPQWKIGNKWSVNFDGSIIGLSRLHHTWDYTTDYYSNHNKEDDYGLNGHFYTFTVGMSYYLGKKESHADWTPTKSVNKSDLDAIAAENEKMRLGMADDDKDGVPNYLDQELDTPEGNPVDMKGVTDLNQLDSDKDGIADSYDACPNEKGPYSTNGCPDSDKDGVADKDDKCPNEPGNIAEGGCKPARTMSNTGSDLPIVYFMTSSFELSNTAKAKLDATAKTLKANPNQTVVLNGHADASGTEEFNQSLSINRAEEAKRYLMQKGINASRISTKSFAATQPAESNDTVEGRAMNRRVEIQLK